MRNVRWRPVMNSTPRQRLTELSWTFFRMVFSLTRQKYYIPSWKGSKSEVEWVSPHFFVIELIDNNWLLLFISIKWKNAWAAVPLSRKGKNLNMKKVSISSSKTTISPFRKTKAKGLSWKPLSPFSTPKAATSTSQYKTLKALSKGQNSMKRIKKNFNSSLMH